jgi:hypothetical protein
MTHVRGPGGLVPGLATNYHSVIVASAITLGQPSKRIAELFNPNIFAELGYFGVFEAAKAALFTEFDLEGYDLQPHFDAWMQQAGQFMYTINHPQILVLATLCRLALARVGRLDPTTPPVERHRRLLGDPFHLADLSCARKANIFAWVDNLPGYFIRLGGRANEGAAARRIYYCFFPDIQ